MALGDQINSVCDGDGTTFCPNPGQVPQSILTINAIHGLTKSSTTSDGTVTIEAVTDDTTIEVNVDNELQVKNKGITLEKIQDIESGKVLGRTSVGEGSLELLDISDIIPVPSWQATMDIGNTSTRPVQIVGGQGGSIGTDNLTLMHQPGGSSMILSFDTVGVVRSTIEFLDAGTIVSAHVGNLDLLSSSGNTYLAGNEVHIHGINGLKFSTIDGTPTGIPAIFETRIKAVAAVDNDDVVIKSQLSPYLTEETDPIFISQKGQPNGVPTTDGNNLIPIAFLPPLAITDTFPVASQAAMLALTAQRGDVAVRTDLGLSFILRIEPATTLSNWVQLNTPSGETDPVFTASPAFGISSTNIANWNTAFGWGNHTGLYVPLARTVTAGTGLNGGGALSANISLSIDAEYNSFTNYYTKTNLQTTGAALVHFENITNVPTFWQESNHPAGSEFGLNLTGATVLSVLGTNSAGHVTIAASRVLTPANIGAVPIARIVTAGSGLTGGGNLANDISLAVNFGTTAGTVAQGNDTRINNGQTAFGWGNHAGLYPPVARTITAGTGLTGGGDLSANRSIAIDPAYASFTNYYTKTNLQTSGQAIVHWENISNVPNSGAFIFNQNAAAQSPGNAWIVGRFRGLKGVFGVAVPVDDVALEVGSLPSADGLAARLNGRVKLEAAENADEAVRLDQMTLDNVLTEGNTSIQAATVGELIADKGSGLGRSRVSITPGDAAFSNIIHEVNTGSGFEVSGNLSLISDQITLDAPFVTTTDKLTITGQIEILGGTPGVGKVLTSNAGGLSTWELLNAPIQLQTIYTDASNTTAPGTMHSFNIPSAYLANSGDKIEIVYGGTFAATATTKLAGIAINGTDVVTLSAGTTSAGNWTARGTIVRVSNTEVRFTGSVTINDTTLDDMTLPSYNSITGLNLAVNGLDVAAFGGTPVGNTTCSIGSITYYPAP